MVVSTVCVGGLPFTEDTTEPFSGISWTFFPGIKLSSGMGTVIPRLDEGKRFSRQESVLLQHEGTVGPVSIVMSATVQQMESGAP